MTTWMWVAFLLMLFGLSVTCSTIPFFKELSSRYGFVSSPGGRRYHDQPTPLLGGAAIYLPFAVVFVAFLALRAAGTISSPQPTVTTMVSLFLGATWMLAVGMIDDRFTIGWRKKLVGQFLGALVLALGGHTIAKATLPLVGLVDFGRFGIPLLMVGVVAVVNAINLIDGLDGLAGGICFFAALTSGTIALFKADLFTAVVGFTVAGALLGFLMFNFPPGSIFLGDGGSMMLGFLLATLAISSAALKPGQRFGTSLMIFVPFLPFGVPLFEVALSVIRRWIKGQSIFLGDTNHLHHRLVGKIKNPRLTVAVFYFFSAALCALTLFIVFEVEATLFKYLAGLVTVVLFAGAAASISLYRLDTLFGTLKNRRHFKFLGRFLKFMKDRISMARSYEELLSLLETGVRDLGFDSVEVIQDGNARARWANPRPLHRGGSRIHSEETFQEYRLTVKWVRPLHEDEVYNEYLLLTWYRVLTAFRNELSSRSWGLADPKRTNVLDLKEKL